MTDPERRLEEVLRRVGDDYLRGHPPDLHRARTTVHRIRRRRAARAGALSALGAAAAVAVAVYAWPADVARDRPRPAARITLPGAVTIPVGEAPGEIAAGDGAIWVSNTGSGSVSRIDPDHDEVVQTIPLEGTPGDLAVDEAGHVWVADRELGFVQRIDGVTNAFTPNMQVRVADPGTPLDLAMGESLWASEVGGDLFQIDPATGRTERAIPGLDPVNVAARDGSVFVLSSDGALRGVDPATGEPNGFELQLDVSDRGDVHLYDGTLWVADGDGSELQAVDAESAAPEARTFSFRGEYVEMVQVPDGVLVLSDAGGVGVLSLIDAAGETVEVLELPFTPRDLVRGAGSLWVSSAVAGTVTRLPDLPSRG